MKIFIPSHPKKKNCFFCTFYCQSQTWDRGLCPFVKAWEWLFWLGWCAPMPRRGVAGKRKERRWTAWSFSWILPAFSSWALLNWLLKHTDDFNGPFFHGFHSPFSLAYTSSCSKKPCNFYFLSSQGIACFISFLYTANFIRLNLSKIARNSNSLFTVSVTFRI